MLNLCQMSQRTLGMAIGLNIKIGKSDAEDPANGMKVCTRNRDQDGPRSRCKSRLARDPIRL